MNDILVYVQDPSKLAELEGKSRGYRKDIYAKIDQEYFHLAFYEIRALAREYEKAIEKHGFYLIDHNINVVMKLDQITILSTVKQMLFNHYFDEAKTVDVSNLILYPLEQDFENHHLKQE